MPTYRIKEHNFKLSGGMSISSLNTNLTIQPIDVTTKVVGDPKQPVTALLKGDPAAPITSRLEGNPDQPVATTSDITLKNLPEFTKEDLKDLLTPEVRMRIPNYNQVCFKLLGVELFSICLSGESQVITEPYVPNAYERCEVICCEPDTRPFPGSNNPTPGIADAGTGAKVVK